MSFKDCPVGNRKVLRIKHRCKMWPKNSLQQRSRLLIISFTAVLTVLVETTQAQAFLLSLGQSRIIYPSIRVAEPYNRNSYGPWTVEIERQQAADHSSLNSTKTINVGRKDHDIQTQDDNSTIIFVKNPNTSELSQTAMDVITIVWYVATFLALGAFFLLMACSDKRCCHSNNEGARNNEAAAPPPTPSPSYSEFAPPSYETVMKMQPAANSIFVIPLRKDDSEKGDNGNISVTNNGSSNNVDCLLNTSTSPSIVNFYTINELQKFGNSSS